MAEQREHLNEPILPHARKDFLELRQDYSVEQALAAIREHGVGEKVVYFYVVDEGEHLLNVLPTRRLLTSPLARKLSEIMILKAVTIPHTATIMGGCEMFVMHRFVAFPMVDHERRVIGVVDVGVFTDEVLEIGESERTDEVFEALGFRISQVRTLAGVSSAVSLAPDEALRHESGTALLLGAGSGLVGGDHCECLEWTGISAGGDRVQRLLVVDRRMPFRVERSGLRLDPKIAAGPATLAVTDITTLLVYFSLGAILLTQG